MSNKETKKSEEVQEEKIVSLCEDMNPSEHDNESYEKALAHQRKAAQSGPFNDDKTWEKK